LVPGRVRARGRRRRRALPRAGAAVPAAPPRAGARRRGAARGRLQRARAGGAGGRRGRRGRPVRDAPGSGRAKGPTAPLWMFVHVGCAAATYVCSKLAADGFPSPESLTLARSLAATLLLLALTGTVIPKPDFDGPTWLKLFGLGILQVPINQYLFLRGLKSTAPGHSALLYALTPLVVLLIISARARASPPRRVAH